MVVLRADRTSIVVQFAVLGLSLFVCFIAAAVGGFVTTSQIPGWYAALSKPVWTPPNSVFGPVWTLLYFLMAVAAWLVWRQSGTRKARSALSLFAAQLVLNLAWSLLFFGLHSPALAFVDILLLWAAILVTLLQFTRHSLGAGLLLVPYLAWVTFAAALNWSIWQMN